jgi:uncharacterized protein (TIGR03437 family)
MKSFLKLAALGAFVVAAATAQPTIAGLVNNWSNIKPGLPNYGIAQGSIFDIYGTGLSNSTSAQTIPLPTTLNGVTINVTVSGTTVSCPIYFLSSGQINAILPSKTAVGTGTITVTNNGQTSAASPIKVVQSAFGTDVLNADGATAYSNVVGGAAAFDANNKSAYLGFNAAANPGDTIILWGTGLGPVTGDETQVQTQTDLTNIPIEVDIGGVKAVVAYHGRSQFPGEDQINVVVPAGVSGCSVSVLVVTGSYVSNFATIPVAPTGRICSDSNSVLSIPGLQTLINKGTFTIGSVGVSKTTTQTPGITVGGITVGGGTSTIDSGSAVFYRYTAAQFLGDTAFSQVTSIGSCNVFSYIGNAPTANPAPPTFLNAGPAVNVTGPNGTKSMPIQNGIYFAQLGGGSGAGALPVFIPASGGTFKFDNGSGGTDVGPFTTQISLAPPVVWSNIDSISTITRTQGVDVTWTGGDANTFVQISGASFQLNPSLFGLFTCTAPVSAHTFHVPASVLLSIPASTSVSTGGVNISVSTLSVGNYANQIQFNAPNVDLSFVSASAITSKGGITYQ